MEGCIWKWVELRAWFMRLYDVEGLTHKSVQLSRSGDVMNSDN